MWWLCILDFWSAVTGKKNHPMWTIQYLEDSVLEYCIGVFGIRLYNFIVCFVFFGGNFACDSKKVFLHCICFGYYIGFLGPITADKFAAVTV